MRLSVFILTNVEAILQDWEDFARALGAVTSEMDIAALRDHAEVILHAVALDMERARTNEQREARGKSNAPARALDLPETAATTHGSDRAEENFSLAQMVSEYRALRASVLRRWARVQSIPNAESYEELMRFNEAIDEALADSIRSYARSVELTAAGRARARMAAVGTLAAGLGHDMSNVLLPMRACLNMLAEERLTLDTASLVDAIRRAVDHLGGLTTGLRALSMDPDNSGIAQSPDALPSVNLHEWWATAISPFTWVLPKGVRLHVDGLGRGDRALPPVRVPPHVLMQAVFNLVQNAAQALNGRHADDPGLADALQTKTTGNIWISAGVEAPTPDAAGIGADRTGKNEGNGADGEFEKNGGAVYLTVQDDGPGMDTQTLTRCCEPFFTTKARNQGLGMGLYLARTGLELHGGRLLVESKVGKGTTFTLVLPAAITTQEARSASAERPTTTARP